MKSEILRNRLEGIRVILEGVHKSSSDLSDASKGSERQEFIDSFLSMVFPPPYRFGSGDIVDLEGRRSGQLDVVVEYSFLPSLSSVGSDTTRLYLAEGVAGSY